MTTNTNNPTDQFGEETLFHGRTHPKVLFVPAVIQVLLLGLHVLAMRYFPDVGNDKFDTWSGPVIHSLIFAAETWYVIVPVLRWRFSSFEVTDTRVRERWGVLYKNTRDIDLNRITQVNEERGIIDRIFGAGTIVIHDAANASALSIDDVPRFNEVRQILEDARRGRSQQTQQPVPQQPDFGQPVHQPVPPQPDFGQPIPPQPVPRQPNFGAPAQPPFPPATQQDPTV